MALEKNYSAQCLSGPGGAFELPESARKILCFVDREWLYVANGHEADFWVLSFKEHLNRLGLKYHTRFKTINEISEYYSGKSSGRLLRNKSSRQEEVIRLIHDAVKKRSSDIHIIVSNEKTEIKCRIDGSLQKVNELSNRDGNDLCATIYQTMCDIAEPVFNPRRSQDAHLLTDMMPKLNLYGGRIATRPTDRGLLMVIRLLYNRMGEAVTLSGLGYLSDQIRMIDRMRCRRYGINIFSGPTGSGKSTTLECVMREILNTKQGKVHLMTIEDPPEYRIDGAVQTPIICDKEDDNAVSQEWAHAIGNAVRLDPDILMSGEVRDVSSASATFRAAMTGHGVWTTVHANDALAILTRLQDIGVALGLLTDASLVTGLVNQVLARTLCKKCKIPFKASALNAPEDFLARIDKYCLPKSMCLRGPGCANCSGTGIKGRTVVAEVIEPTLELMDIYIQKGKNAAKKFWIDSLKGKTKNRVVIEKINQGLLDPRDAEEDVCLLDEDDLILGNAS